MELACNRIAEAPVAANNVEMMHNLDVVNERLYTDEVTRCVATPCRVLCRHCPQKHHVLCALFRERNVSDMQVKSEPGLVVQENAVLTKIASLRRMLT